MYSVFFANLHKLVDIVGADGIKLRFDPIVHYRVAGSDEARYNLRNFETIIQRAAALGIKRVIIAFCVDGAVIERIYSDVHLRTRSKNLILN